MAAVSEFVALDVSDGVATIRVDKPPTNALDTQVLDELRAAAAAAATDRAVAAVVFYGGEKFFAVGDDARELAALTPGMLADRHAALAAIAELPKPTVAAISGYAFDTGLELALCADRRIVGDNAKLSLGAIRQGLIPSGGAHVRLARLIGASAAKDLIFTGRYVEADEARALGLVDEVVAPDDVYVAARRWAAQFDGAPALALAAAKAAIEAADSSVERERFATLLASRDAQSGLASYLADGPNSARFTGE